MLGLPRNGHVVWLARSLLLGLFAVPMARVNAQAPPHPSPPAYKTLRYDEDYSYLKDPSRRADPWDPIKYIPLGGREDWYLSIGGEVRPRYELYRNSDFGSEPSSANRVNDYLLQRYFLHGDWHLGQDFRLFTQISSNFENGRIGGPRPDIDENAFAFLQTFADGVIRRGEEDTLTVRLGRQMLDYGSDRLVSTRDGTNVPRTFLAPRVLLRSGEWAVDGFWSRPMRNNIGAFDDEPDPRRQFWGVYAVRPLRLLPDGHADLYYLGFDNERATFSQGTGRELRHTLGTRLWGNPEPWDYNFEFIGQFGTFGPGRIQAWAAASDTGYTLARAPLRPRLGLRADIASGDDDPNSANLQTFNPLFPRATYFNWAVQIGPSNLIDVHPTLDLFVGEKLRFTLDWDFVWRESLDDGVYSIGVVPIRPGRPSRARYVASAPEAVITWTPTRHVTILAAYVHYFAGPFLEQTPPGKDVDFFTVWVGYKF